MSRCIYCLDPLVPKAAGDGPKNPSLEHVVPWALGGSNGCATDEVCRECNSTLGDSVDAACINQSIVMMTRHQFGIAGQSGTLPDLVMPTRSMETNEPGRMIFPPQEAVTVKHEPVVIREPMTDAEKVFVAGSRDDVGRILRGMANKAKARGQRLINPDGSELDIDAVVASAEAEVSTTYHVPTTVDLTGIRRELAKIAFGFLHLVLGWEWTGSPASEPLRRVARGVSSADEVDAAMMSVSNGFRGLLPLAHAQPTDHVIALMPATIPG